MSNVDGEVIDAEVVEVVDGEVVEVVDGEVIDAEVVEVVDAEVVEVVDGEVVGNYFDDDDFDDYFDDEIIVSGKFSQNFKDRKLNTELDGLNFEELKEAVKKEQDTPPALLSVSQHKFNREFNSINMADRQSKYSTLMYLLKKKTDILSNELKYLEKEIVDEYSSAYRSSAQKYEHIKNNLCAESPADLNICINNTIYFYSVNNCSIKEIIENLSWRLTLLKLSGMGTPTVSSDQLRQRIEEYKYHMSILVPIIIRQYTHSFYASELEESNYLYTLLTPQIFSDIKEGDKYVVNDTNGFDTNEGLVEILEKESSNFYNSYYAGIIVTRKVTQKIIEWGKEHGVAWKEYAIVDELLSKIGHIPMDKLIEYEWDTLDFMGNFDDALRGNFKESIKGYLSEIKAMVPPGFKWNCGKIGTANSGIQYFDPNITYSWSSLYSNPFLDTKLIQVYSSVFLSKAEELYGEKIDYDPTRILEDLLNNKFKDVTGQIVDFLIQLVYRKLSIKTSNLVIAGAEFHNFIENNRIKLGIKDKVVKDGETVTNFFDKLAYLDDIEYLPELASVSVTDNNTVGDTNSQVLTFNCNCGIIDAKAEIGSNIDVENFLTSIRLRALKKDYTPKEIEIAKEVSGNVEELRITNNFIEKKIDARRKISEYRVSASSGIGVLQNMCRCPNCGKLYMFTEGTYRMLDLCYIYAVKDMTFSAANFVEKLVLSKNTIDDCVDEINQYIYEIQNGDNENVDSSNKDEINAFNKACESLVLPAVKELDIRKETGKEYTEFDELARKYIDTLKSFKEEYVYDMISKAYDEDLNNKFEDVPQFDFSNPLGEFDEIENSSTPNVSENSDEGFTDAKEAIDKRYCNNIIWYLLRENTGGAMNEERALKHFLLKTIGKVRISKILEIMDKVEKKLSILNELQFKEIQLNAKEGIFPELENIQFPELNNSLADMKIKKYLNLAKRVKVNSKTVEEFEENLPNCKVDKEDMPKALQEVLISYYEEGKEIEYDDPELVRVGNKAINSGVDIADLRVEIDDLIGELAEVTADLEVQNDDVEVSEFKFEYDSKIKVESSDYEFDVEKILLFFGCKRWEEKSKYNINFNKILSENEEQINDAVKLINNSIVELDEMEYVYACSIFRRFIREICAVDTDLDNLIFADFYDSYGFLVRYEPEVNGELDMAKAASIIKKEYIMYLISYNFEKLTLNAKSVGLDYLAKQLEDNIEEFTFDVLHQYPLVLESVNLFNSAIGSALYKFKDYWYDESIDEDILKKFSNFTAIVPRLRGQTASSGINQVKKLIKDDSSGKYEIPIKPNGCNGVIRNELKDKSIPYIVYLFTVFMDSGAKIRKNLYPVLGSNVFDLFEVITNLPRSLVEKGFKDTYTLREEDGNLKYDYIANNLKYIASTDAIYEAVSRKNNSIILESESLQEKTVINLLCLDSNKISTDLDKGIRRM